MMRGYRAFREFRVLASYRVARMCLMEMAGERPWVLLHWEMPSGVMTERFLRTVKQAQRRAASYVALGMEAEAMHILHLAGRKRAYRAAARAYASGLLERQDLANVGVGLTKEQRDQISFSVLSERAS